VVLGINKRLWIIKVVLIKVSSEESVNFKIYTI